MDENSRVTLETELVEVLILVEKRVEFLGQDKFPKIISMDLQKTSQAKKLLPVLSKLIYKAFLVFHLSIEASL